MLVWRICRERHIDSAFSGNGARITPGRWNSEGVPVVYTSTSLALAAVELFVHVDKEEEPDDLMAIAVDVPDEAESLEDQQSWLFSRLPNDWRIGEPEVTRQIGDEWMQSRRSLTMPVPSVVIDGEWNLLFNPEHPSASQLIRRDVRPFRFDPRMFR